ncbi:flotillin family protein [Lusitaniella coriacea LEGE 07157]|uniref:Flotillin family protein n=1 Tax=Lusitaniella coriacea LEGE 07157 TaxID=945747 RepID=A0A8J7E1Q3_9CYAN|nr:SPFH domain-containing protein [Lusitaniella coriacea]MBE9117464.1 flotillin family protein [Lusitaniella coriacea LEGE 07157]
MLFWLALLESLPSISTVEVDKEIQELSPGFNRKTEEILIAQNASSVEQPIALQNFGNGILFPASLVVGVFVLLVLSLWSYKLVYKITPNNEAFVRTGGLFVKQQTVILHGGCVVLPGFHELTRVPLREISIDVERTDHLAVRTQDYLRANMRVTFYVCISADKEDVKNAAARLSKKGMISEVDIKEALEKRADDAIRAAAKKKSLAEIDSDKLGFADEVYNLIQQDLKKVGLTLNNIAISEIEESDTYDENNFFDAQGVKLRTETIQRSIQQKREVELLTKVTIEQQELDAEKRSLQISQETEAAQLNQTKEVAALRLTQQQEIEALTAQREREIQEAKDKEAAKIERNKILQEKAVEEENIHKKLSIQQSQIEADIALEEQNKKLKVAQIVQKQEAEVAEIARQQMVDAELLRARIDVAEAERESKTAQEEAAIAIANKERDRLVAEAERAQAEAGVITAQEVEGAERERQLSAIAAEKEAEKQRISQQNVVELDVFRRRRQAEIARQAAELEAESIRTLAEANRIKALAEAEGSQALIEAENALSTANRVAKLLEGILPDIAEKLPEISRNLAPQRGVLGETKIYSFPGANGTNGNGSGVGDINKLLLSTSGLSLINTLLDEGKLGTLAAQVKQLLSSEETKPSQTTPKPPAQTLRPSQSAAKPQTPPPSSQKPNNTPRDRA